MRDAINVFGDPSDADVTMLLEKAPLTSEAKVGEGVTKHPLEARPGTPCRYSVGC